MLHRENQYAVVQQFGNNITVHQLFAECHLYAELRKYTRMKEKVHHIKINLKT